MTAEEQLLETQREFDAQKEECHAHMKVIQRLKNPSNSSTNANMPNSDRFTLQLELVECKRNLFKAQEELEKLKNQVHL